MKFLSNRELLLLFVASLLSALSSSTYSIDGSTAASMSFSAVFVLLSIFLPLEQQLFLVALAIPNTKALGFGGISCSILICAISGLKYHLFAGKKPHIPIGVILYLIYCVQFYVRFNDFLIGFVMPIKQAMNMLFFVVLATDRRIAGNAFQIGFKSSLFLFAGIVSAFFFSSITSSSGRLAAAGNDPNILSVEVAFVLSFVCLAYGKLKQMSLPAFSVILGVLAIVSALCGSRMGFLLFGIVLFVTVIFNSRSISNVAGLLIIVVIAFGIFVTSQFGQGIIEAVQYRMYLLEANDNMSNGRFETWNLYISVLNSSPYMWIFGMGDYTQYGIENQAHNFLFEDLSGYGILGLLILYPTYFAIYKTLYKNAYIYGGKPNKGIYRFLPLLVPLIGGLTLHGLVSIMNTTMLFLGAMALTKIPEPNRL